VIIGPGRMAREEADEPAAPGHAARQSAPAGVFFEAEDYRLYRRLIGAAAGRSSCRDPGPLPDHVHLVVTPIEEDGLRARRTGHLCQGRFGAVAMDEAALVAAARYLALNPVAAGLVSCTEDWPWSTPAPISRARTTSWRSSRRCARVSRLRRLPCRGFRRSGGCPVRTNRDDRTVARTPSANRHARSAAPPLARAAQTRSQTARRQDTAPATSLAGLCKLSP
jgi:hypothetical protein